MAITLPYGDFTPGTTISSAQVDANFDALAEGAVNKAGDTMTGTLNARDLLPSSTGTYDLGSSSFTWAEAYATALYVSQIFERSRLVALGEWQNQAFSAAHYTGNGTMTWTVASGDVADNRYTLIGKTLLWNLRVGATTVGGTPNTELRVNLPDGRTVAANATVKCGYANDNGTVRDAFVDAADGNDYVSIQLDSGANWTATTDATFIYFQIAIEVE